MVDRFIFFFFSSRRRHTRFDCDWSSDVCSSDLRWMDAGEAKHWGLANHVVPKGQGLAKAREIAQQLAEGPPLLFPAIKQLLRHTEMVAEHAAFELHDSLDAVQKVIRSQDLKEGTRAFAEKRKPVWKGK